MCAFILAMIFDSAIFFFQKACEILSGVSTSILVANGALLAMISLRNGHLSDRSRATVEEYLYKLPNMNLSKAVQRERGASLESQSSEFNDRYRRTSRAFMFLMMSLFGFLATTLLGAVTLDRPTGGKSTTASVVVNWFHFAGGIAGSMSLLILLCGLVIFMREFRKGPITLEENRKAFKYPLDESN